MNSILNGGRTLLQGLMPGMLALALAGAAHAQDPKVNFSKLVVVGDSLAAGVENGSLEDSQQQNGFAAVIARQASTPLTLPLVPYPGAPNTDAIIYIGSFPVLIQVPGQLIIPRDNPFSTVTDVAVPLQTVGDALSRVPNKSLQGADLTQLATDLVLGLPCPILLPCPALTQVQYAVALRPTVLIVDLGNNDILGPVTSGQVDGLLTTSGQATFLANFTTSYTALLNQLGASGATMIVGNVPDVTEAAYFFQVAKLEAGANLPPGSLATSLGIGEGDYVTLAALPSVQAIATGSKPGPLPTFCVSGSPTTACILTAAQAAGARQLSMAINQIIATQAAAHNATVVDLFSVIDNLSASGYQAGSKMLTTNFLGGLFSLDGMHPTNTGYAIMANEFIKDINAAYGTTIAPANVASIAQHDPLILH